MPRECLRPGKRQAWTPMRVVRVLRVLQGFKRLRDGKRQAWTPMTGCKGFKRLESF